MKERYRERRGFQWIDDLGQDVRYGGRALLRQRGFTAIVVVTLALGIGANTAIFSLIDALLLKQLPVTEPQQLTVLTNPAVGGAQDGLVVGERSHVSFAEFEALRDRAHTFAGILAVQAWTGTQQVKVNGQAPEDVRAKLVSGEYFTVLGVPAYVGRTFVAADERGPGTAPFAVISYRYWQRRFGGASSVINSRLQIADATLDIVGVTAPTFLGESVGETPDVWIPLAMQPQIMPGVNWLRGGRGNMMWLHAIGRLKPGTSRQQAQADVDVVFKESLLDEYSRRTGPVPDMFNQHLTVHDASTGVSSVRGQFASSLLILMGVVALVLAIACANVATLLLARAAAREKELSLRLAVGAGRVRIVRQLLTESVMLAAAGGVIGILLAFMGVRLLTRMMLGTADSTMLEVRPDLRTLLFTLGVSVLTAVVFGLAPAWKSAGVNIAGALDAVRRGGSWSTARVGTGKALVIAQIALSVMLVIGAGWFLKTLHNFEQADLGYPRQRLVQMEVNFAPAGYSGDRLPIAYGALRDRLARLPGVRAVTYSDTGLLGDNYLPIGVEGYSAQRPGDTVVKFNSVGPDYLSTVGISILHGRDIGPRDVASALPVCVVNETFAKFYFGTHDPLGRHVTAGKAVFVIVGVSRDVRDTIDYPLSLADTLRHEIPRTLYLSALQPSFSAGYSTSISYQIHTFANPPGVIEAVRTETMSFNPSMSLRDAASLDSFIEDHLRNERIVAQLSTGFGGLALLLACVGLYGVLSYAVARRINEFGIRMALGAERGTVIRMVARETAMLVLVGLTIGVSASLACARFVESKLFGLTPGDPLTLTAAAGIIITVALVAGYVPARRAARVDPLVALRCE